MCNQRFDKAAHILNKHKKIGLKSATHAAQSPYVARILNSARAHNVVDANLHPTPLTASEDGVVCFFDCRIPDEDDAIESILNVESAVTTVGFLVLKEKTLFVSQALKRLYCQLD
ncbi:hypothetical protein Plhal703r1_c41g0141411 [Plasmopara halstedii]